MALTITRYRAQDQTPGSLQTVYEVPVGKVAKIKFNSGLLTEAIPLFIDETASKTICVNSIKAVNTQYSARLLVAGLLIMGSANPSSSNYVFSFNMFFSGDGTIKTPIDLPNTTNCDYTDAAVSARVHKTFENSFILTAGEKVEISTNDTNINAASVNYDFTVYEEDI